MDSEGVDMNAAVTKLYLWKLRRFGLETPDHLLQRLEKMGPDKVRALIGMRHFEGKTLPLVKGWLDRREKEESKAEVRDVLADTDRALENTRKLARQSSSGATKLAARAERAARRAQRLATIALVVASISTLVAFLSLFALAIR